MRRGPVGFQVCTPATTITSAMSTFRTKNCCAWPGATMLLRRSGMTSTECFTPGTTSASLPGVYGFRPATRPMPLTSPRTPCSGRTERSIDFRARAVSGRGCTPLHVGRRSTAVPPALADRPPAWTTSCWPSSRLGRKVGQILHPKKRSIGAPESAGYGVPWPNISSPSNNESSISTTTTP